jgi:hypothetical protein
LTFTATADSHVFPPPQTVQLTTSEGK